MESTIRTAMIAANHILDKQAIVANNLANISTLGFKQQLTTQLTSPNKYSIQSFNHEKEKPYHLYSDLSSGPILHTNRPLDISVQGNGWLTVEDNTTKNKESYTRNGHLQINHNRQLTINKHLVLGLKGPITVPITGDLNISSHGVISVFNPKDHQLKNIYLGQLKLINIKNKNIERGNNGFFYINKKKLTKFKNNIFNKIKISSGNLEDSNVNLNENLINMISYERQFSIAMKLISNCDESTKMANQLLNNNTF